MSASTAKGSKLSIVYFGSGPLAAVSLAYLHEHFAIECVITKPRALHHKGSVPVIDYCVKHNLRHITPATKAELAAHISQERFVSRMGVVIDYGIIISRDVIETFPLGIVNSHFSLLPEWRGADPITFAILSGQSETGVSLMLINERMDEGPLLAQAAVSIAPTTDAISLTRELTDVSNALLSEILPLYSNGNIQPVPQANGIGPKMPSYSRKLTKSDGLLDWYKPANQLEREIRAFGEWPKSRTKLGDIEVIIIEAHTTPGTVTQSPGHLEVLADQGLLMINTTDGYLCIDRLKPAGKKAMSAAEFIRGYGSRLTIAS